MSPDEMALDSRLRELWSLPVLSQEFRDGPVAELKYERLRLRYDYETERGQYAWQEVVFDGVQALGFIAHDACTAEMIDAYDRLVEVRDSTWIAQLQAARREPVPDLLHLRIYFDEVGCYEVLATRFQVPQPPPE